MKTLKVLDIFTGRYSGASLQVRKKSRILATISLIFGGISVLFGALMAVTGSIVPAFVFVALTVFCGAVLLLLRAGRYHLASSAFLYGLMAAMFVAIKFGEYASNVYNTYVMGTLGGFLLVVAALVADRPSQAIVIGILNLASIEAIYWIDSHPHDNYQVTILAIQNLSVSSLMTILGAGIAAYLVRLTSGLLSEVERKAQAAEKSYRELTEVAGRAQASSLGIGQSLASSMGRTLDTIASLKAKVVEIAMGMDELDLSLEVSGQANGRAELGQAEVRTALSAYSDQVSRASSAIEEMAAAATSLAAQAGGKREAVQDLVEISRAGEGIIGSMTASIEEIKDLAQGVSALGAIIGEVADRTNLLGMNASIEAAHAGSAGRGFAVVANEIRTLSIETAKSARIISDTLKEVQAKVAVASGRSGEALGAFRRINEGIQGVSLMIEELLANLQELSLGTVDVVSAVETVSELTRATEKAVQLSSTGMAESMLGTRKVASIASRVRSETAVMTDRFEGMHKDAEGLKSLGDENLALVQELKASLVAFAQKSDLA